MAQSEYLKQYKKDHKDKVAKWNKKYQETYKEELKAKRQLKVREAQNARLQELIDDLNRLTLQELNEKYIVRLRLTRSK